MSLCPHVCSGGHRSSQQKNKMPPKEKNHPKRGPVWKTEDNLQIIRFVKSFYPNNPLVGLRSLKADNLWKQLSIDLKTAGIERSSTSLFDHFRTMTNNLKMIRANCTNKLPDLKGISEEEKSDQLNSYAAELFSLLNQIDKEKDHKLHSELSSLKWWNAQVLHELVELQLFDEVGTKVQTPDEIGNIVQRAQKQIWTGERRENESFRREKKAR